MGPTYQEIADAAQELGVSLTTLYAYVSRKGIRTEKLPGVRERLYWKADVWKARGRRATPAPTLEPDGVSTASKITFIGDDGPYYRGQNAVLLSDDLLPNVLTSLSLSSTQPLVCNTWRNC